MDAGRVEQLRQLLHQRLPTDVFCELLESELQWLVVNQWDTPGKLQGATVDQLKEGVAPGTAKAICRAFDVTMMLVAVKAEVGGQEDSEEQLFLASQPVQAVADACGHVAKTITLKRSEGDVTMGLGMRLCEVASVDPGRGVRGRPHVFRIEQAGHPGAGGGTALADPPTTVAVRAEGQEDSEERLFLASQPVQAVAVAYGHVAKTITVKRSEGDVTMGLGMRLCEVASVDPGRGVRGRPHVFRIEQAGHPGAGGGTALAGPSKALTQERRRGLLVQRFGSQLRERLKHLPGQLAKRSGPIEAGPNNRVFSIGQHFPLCGMKGPVKQLFQLLVVKDSEFQLCGTGLDKPTQCLNLLKLVAAPGMGRSTALGALWPELYKFVSEHEDTLRKQLSLYGYEDSHIIDRVLCSMKPDQPLVFIMDLDAIGLGDLCYREMTLDPAQQLALRMLFSTLYDSNTSGTQYETFVCDLGKAMDLRGLQPLDVMWFVEATLQLGTQYSMAVFAFDEVNAVLRPSDGSASWVQNVLSAFVDMRCAAGQQQLRMMPVAIIASTLDSATSLAGTASAKATVAEVQLMPTSYQDAKVILMDVCRRLGQPLCSADIKAHVKQMLKMVCGCPRHLAWAMSLMSGSEYWTFPERLLLGKEQGCPCPWLSEALVDASDVLERLLQAFGHLPGNKWLTEDSKAETLRKVMAHSMLGRKVHRAYVIMPAGPYQHKPISWQDVEDAGFCSLVRTELDSSYDSPDSSRASSVGGPGEPCSSDMQQPTQSLGEAVASDVLSGMHQLVPSVFSNSSGYTVFLSPLLAVAAMRCLRRLNSRFEIPRMVLRTVDDWHSRERSDNAVPLVRLQLAATFREASEVELSALLPFGAELPYCYWDLRIQLPSNIDTNPTRNVGEQLSQEAFEELCTQASYDREYAFIGPGNSGPDSWLVLQTVGSAGPLVLFIQSKKRSKHEHVRPEHLEEEAKKCWGKGSGLQRLLLYVTDQQTDHVPSHLYVEEVDLHVVVLGLKQHLRFYSNAVALLKHCIESDEMGRKRTRSG